VLTLVPSLALFTFGIGESILLLAVIMLLFGAKKLPELARGLGAGIRNFKGELKPPDDDRDER
jgi:sec-independent protein translocase protein TatA